MRTKEFIHIKEFDAPRPIFDDKPLLSDFQIGWLSGVVGVLAGLAIGFFIW